MSQQFFYPDSGVASSYWASVPVRFYSGGSTSAFNPVLPSIGSGSFANYNQLWEPNPFVNGLFYSSSSDNDTQISYGGSFYLTNDLHVGYQSGLTNLANFVKLNVVYRNIRGTPFGIRDMGIISNITVYSGATPVDTLLGPSSYVPPASSNYVNVLGEAGAAQSGVITFANATEYDAVQYNKYMNASGYRLELSFSVLDCPNYNYYLNSEIHSINVEFNGETYLQESGSCPLYISGPIPVNSGHTLFLDSHPPDRSGTLYISGSETEETGLTLYVAGAGKSSGNCDLFINNFPDGAIDLFIKAVDPQSTSNSMTLNVWAPGSSSGYWNDQCTLHTINYGVESGNAPLFISGPDSGVVFDNHTLFIKSVDPVTFNNVDSRNLLPLVMWNNQLNYSGNTTLYIGNSVGASGYTTMYIEGGGTDNRQNAVDLVMYSVASGNNAMTLHTLGGMSQAFHPLFLQSFDAVPADSGTSLFVYSNATSSGIFGAAELFLQTDVFGSRHDLFISGPTYGTSDSGHPLFIHAGGNADAYAPLMLESTRSSGLGQNLYVGGLGSIPGAYVATGAAPLYIARDIEGNYGNVPLSIAGPTLLSGGTDLTIFGGNYSTNSIGLSVPVVVGPVTSGMETYIHGY